MDKTESNMLWEPGRPVTVYRSDCPNADGAHAFQTVACNPFIYRQTAESRFSHYMPANGDPAQVWSELLKLVAVCMTAQPDRVTVLQNAGKVLKLRLPVRESAGQFFTGVVIVGESTQLVAQFSKRPNALEGEFPFISAFAVGGTKAPAVAADVILYHESNLSEEEKTFIPEGASQPSRVSADWQLVSLNCRTTEADEPPTPVAMARNYLAGLRLPEGTGGTAAEYTAE